MMIRAMALILLLTSINNFCSNIPSLMDICFQRCKNDITDPDNTDLDISIIKSIFNGLRKNEHREEMFNLLVEKKYPAVIAGMETYIDQSIHEMCSQKNHTDLLDLWCKKSIFGDHYTNVSKELPIEMRGQWQKTSCKADRNSELFVLTMPIIGPDNYSSVNHFAAHKIISSYNLENMQENLLNKRSYEVKTELYRAQHEVYINEPFYNKNPDKNYLAKGNWLKEHELTNRLDTFPDNRLIITHAWGGIEVHQGKIIEQFMIGNSISSVSCSSNNKHIALGSYDGTITIVDITQEGTIVIPENKAHFKEYTFEKYPDEKYPCIITSTQLSKNPVTNIQYCPNQATILFSSGENLYCMKLSDNGVYEEHDILFTSESPITHCAQIENFIACISQQNIITVIDTHQKQKNISFKHNSPITSMSAYITEDGNHFVTGDQQGNVLIWKIHSTDLTIDMIIPHAHPVHLVEITKDNKHIVVKTTQEIPWERGEGSDKKDNIVLYPTPHALMENVQKQEQFILDIQKTLTKLQGNPIELYALLSSNKEIFYRNKHKDIIALKNAIENEILNILISDNFFTSIKSIGQFYNVLRSFPSTDYTKPITLNLFGMYSAKKLNLLEDLDAKIKTILSKDVLIKFFTNTLENKNVTYQDKVNIYGMTNYFYWFHFSGNCSTPPSSDLKVLLDKLQIIHELCNPKDNATYYKANLQYFISHNTYPLIGAVVGIPLGYMAYKYFMDKK